MKKRVAIVEDEPHIVESLRFILSKAGHDIVVADNGDAAIDLVKNESPDVMVLDIMLPQKNGFEVLKWIRSQDEYRALPVLMLTAKGQDKDRNTASSLGVDEFIAKPFSNDEVVDTVNRLLAAERHSG